MVECTPENAFVHYTNEKYYQNGNKPFGGYFGQVVAFFSLSFAITWIISAENDNKTAVTSPSMLMRVCVGSYEGWLKNLKLVQEIFCGGINIGMSTGGSFWYCTVGVCSETSGL